MKKVVLSVIVIAGLTVGALAECNSGGCSNVKIESILSLKNGTIVVGTSGDESLLTCAANSGKYLYIPADVAGKNMMYSALLTAQTTKSDVTVRLNDTATECQIAYIFSKAQ